MLFVVVLALVVFLCLLHLSLSCTVFESAAAFNLDVSKWNTEKVEDMWGSKSLSASTCTCIRFFTECVIV